jgi:hypothetical protein
MTWEFFGENGNKWKIRAKIFADLLVKRGWVLRNLGECSSNLTNFREDSHLRFSPTCSLPVANASTSIILFFAAR